MPPSVHRVLRGAARRSGVASALGFGEIIYLIGPTGHPNYGDELIAATWLRYLARERPHATVVLDCHSPGQASLLMRGLHPRLVVVDTLWRLATYAAEADHSGEGSEHAGQPPWEWVAEAATTLGVAPRLAEGIDLLNRAGTIHLIGGGYLNSIWPHHLSLFVAAAAVARKSGARAVATGQGLIPTFAEPARSAMIAAAADFDLVDVRDEASAQAMSEIAGLRFSGDDAWLALSTASAEIFGAAVGDDGVILCLQSDLTEGFRAPGADGRELAGTAALAAFVTATLDAWEVPGERITVIEAIPGHDYEVPVLMGERLSGANVIPFQAVWRHGLPAGGTWISTRFHPHLLAAANGAAGVAISSMPGYYSTKHRSLIESGSRWDLVTDGSDIPPRPHAPGFGAADRARAVEAKAATARHVYPRTFAASPRVLAERLPRGRG